MKKLSAKWQKLIIWLTGYLNIIAFVIAGGYTYLNTEYKAVKATAKKVLLLLAGFTAIDILRTLIYNVISLFEADYNAIEVISKIGTAIAIIKAITFVVLFVLDIKNDMKKEADSEDTSEN